VPLPRTPQPSDCEALLFIHQRYGGVFIILGFLTLIGSFILGGVWSKYGDPTLGWTIALSGAAVIIAYIALAAMVCRM